LANGLTITYTIDGKPQTLTLTFATSDFLDIPNATATEIAAAINAKAVGVMAEVTPEDEVKISCLGTPSNSSVLAITGGTGITALGLSIASHTGWAEDYTLNRYNGQVELATSLSALDTITAGSSNTRAHAKCVSPEMYAMAGGESIDIYVDGGAAVTWTSTLGAGSFTAVQVAADINATAGLIGATAFIKTIAMEDYLCIRTNTQLQSAGSIRVDATSAPSLDFPSAIVYNQDPSMGYVKSGEITTSPLTIGRNQNLIIILDGDLVNRVWNLALQ
jgi:hypothetical protein